MRATPPKSGQKLLHIKQACELPFPVSCIFIMASDSSSTLVSPIHFLRHEFIFIIGIFGFDCRLSSHRPVRLRSNSSAAHSPRRYVYIASILEILWFRTNRSFFSDVPQVLKVANITASKILFKVKTTQPTWYYVRPNQQILAPGQVEDVAILMVETECKYVSSYIAYFSFAPN